MCWAEPKRCKCNRCLASSLTVSASRFRWEARPLQLVNILNMDLLLPLSPLVDAATVVVEADDGA